MSLNYFSDTGKNLDSFALRKKVAGLLESVPKKNSHAFLCHDAARIIAINGQYEGADELAIMALAMALPAQGVVVLQPPLLHVGHGEAPVAVAHVDGDYQLVELEDAPDGDYQLVELEDAPARGLDLFAPALHQPVAVLVPHKHLDAAGQL